jgi:hypothetical protein
MAKQTIEIEVDVPEGHRFSHAIPPAAFANYRHDGKDAKCCHPCVVFTKIEPVRETRWALLHKSPGYWVLGSLFETEDIPKGDAIKHGLRYVRIELEDDMVVSVALEPAEGGG